MPSTHINSTMGQILLVVPCMLLLWGKLAPWCKFFQCSWLWELRKPKAKLQVSIRAGGVIPGKRQRHLKPVLGWEEVIISHAWKIRNNCRNIQPAVRLLDSAEVSCLYEGNALKHSSFRTIKTHAALWFIYLFIYFLRKSKCNKAICCPWGSVGRTTKGRHGAKKFWALPGTYWSPQLPRKAGRVFLDIIRNLWHLAKLNSLALVCTLGYEKGAGHKELKEGLKQSFFNTRMSILRQNPLQSISKNVLVMFW